MRVIHLIRHARPARTGVFLGRLDVALADPRIEPLQIDASVIYASPLRRAAETARSLFPGRDIIQLPELAECGFGRWEGLSWNQIQDQWPEIARAKAAAWRDITPPGGEPWTDFENRIDRAWQRIRCGAFPAAVVAHAGVNALLAARITCIDPLTFQQDFREVMTLELCN